MRKTVEIATVQNLYNLTNRKSEDVVDYCVREAIGFIPWFPIAAGKLAEPGGPVDEIAKKHDATPAQVALAWLLGPRPGDAADPRARRRSRHLEENVGAAGRYSLTRDEVAELTAAGPTKTTRTTTSDE